MKKQRRPIFFSIFLILNLLFSQVSVNFLHSPHSEHEPDVKSRNDQASVHRHGEHCKICSLDVVISFLVSESPKIAVVLPSVQLTGFQLASAETFPVSTIQDRAPPIFVGEGFRF